MFLSILKISNMHLKIWNFRVKSKMDKNKTLKHKLPHVRNNHTKFRGNQSNFFFKGYVWWRYGACWPCPSPFTAELWIFHQVWGQCQFLWVFRYAKALKNTISMQKNNKNLCKKTKGSLQPWCLLCFFRLSCEQWLIPSSHSDGYIQQRWLDAQWKWRLAPKKESSKSQGEQILNSIF